MKKHIYLLVFIILLASCSRQVSLTKLPDGRHSTNAYSSSPTNATPVPIVAPQPVYRIAYTDPRDYYEDAFTQLKSMLEGKQPESFKQAVFITENAWYKNQLNYRAYNKYISSLANVCKAWDKANPLVYDKWDFDSSEVALNGAIYHVMNDTVKDKKGNIITNPYHYDFNNCFARYNWTNMFVTKLMTTHGGNCHSLPFLYKMLAEELGTKAYLSFLPGHIYINQYSRKTSWYNTELTGF